MEGLSEEQLKEIESLTQSCSDHQYGELEKVLLLWTRDSWSCPVVRRICRKCGLTVLYDVHTLLSLSRRTHK